MEPTIYLDVLFLLNFFITALLLGATVRLTNESASKKRILFGSVLGGIYSFSILLELTPWELTLLKILMGVSLVFGVFYRKGQGKRLLKTGFFFFLVNFIFAGFVLALWFFWPVAGMQFKNGVVYFDISALTLALSTTAAYLLISLFSYLLNKRTAKKEKKTLLLSQSGRQVAVSAFTDTGNKLCDVFSGRPVIVAEYSAVKDLLPVSVLEYYQDPGEFAADGEKNTAHFRLVPVSTAYGDGVLPAFVPDSAEIDGRQVEAVVAVTQKKLSNGEYHAILNEALL